MFNIKKYTTYEKACNAAFKEVVSLVTKNPKALICIATGESPIGLYQLFPERSELFRDIKFLKLDEWGGIKPDDPSTCETYIRENIIEPLKLNRKQLLGFRSNSKNPEDECKRIKNLICRYNGIDLCILGIGADGHIGLNFPADTIIPEIHIVPSQYLI
ncbi:MAG: 6-phosphogluconolactonase, partial [Candidatus Hydrogenedens sp.]